MNREQPKNEASSNLSEENLVIGAADAISGSQNKFKDVKDLEEAYLNLQSEFTRKCQKLSELEKENSKIKNVEPFYQKAEWGDYVKQFLQSNNHANNYASEIMEILIQDKVMASAPNSLELAFNKILASKYKSEEQLAFDETFLEKHIYSNKVIKDKIIAEYVKELKKNKSPQIINTSKTGSLNLTPNLKPSNISEAGEIVKKLFY